METSELRRDVHESHTQGCVTEGFFLDRNQSGSFLDRNHSLYIFSDLSFIQLIFVLP